MDEDNFIALQERIEGAREDAAYDLRDGREATVSISVDDCAAIGDLLTKAYGAALLGKRDAVLADQLAILAGAFKGDEED